MTAKQGRDLFNKHCGKAVFRASIVTAANARVLVYPLKSGKGFAWVLWAGDIDYGNIDATIKDGGKLPTKVNLRSAAAVALMHLFQFAPLNAEER